MKIVTLGKYNTLFFYLILQTMFGDWKQKQEENNIDMIVSVCTFNIYETAKKYVIYYIG